MPKPTPSSAPAAPAQRAPAPGIFRVAALVALVVWAVVFAPQLFGGRGYGAGDWPTNLPFAEFSAARWRVSHERTLWNPYVFAGLPSAASLADSRPQYLPDLALDALALLDRAPVWPVLILPLLAHLLGMLAAAALARALWRVGTAAMAWAAIAWGLMPNLLVPLAYGHHAQLVTTGLMPVALLATHALFAAETRRGAWRAALGLALTMGVQALAGHPQFVYYSALLTGGFAIERAWRFSRWPRLGFALGAAALGAAISAATMLPLHAYGLESVRGAGGVALGEVRLYSLALRDFATFGWAHAMGFASPNYWGGLDGTSYPQYLGALVLVALVAGLGLRRGARDGAAWFFAGATALSIVLALGANLGAIYALLDAVVPLWSSFRVAVATLIVAQLGVALLSARVLDAALTLTGRARRRAFAIAAILGVAVALALVVAHAPIERAYSNLIPHRGDVFLGDGAKPLVQFARPAIQDLELGLALVGALLALLFAASARPAFRNVASALLVALLAYDLGRVTVPMLQRQSAGARALAAPPPSARAVAVASVPHSRASTRLPALSDDRNDWVSWRIPSVEGAHGTPPYRWVQLEGTGLGARPAVQRALAVSFVAAAERDTLDASRYERVPGDGGVRGFETELRRVRDSLPRAYAVGEVRNPGNEVGVLSVMADPAWDPARLALCEDPSFVGAYPGSAACTIRWAADEPDRVALDLEANDRAFVVLADAWFGGWSVRIDGAAARLARVDYLVRGVAVPAGRHRLTFAYEPPGWALGVATTRIAFVVWLVLAALAFLPARPPRRA